MTQEMRGSLESLLYPLPTGRNTLPHVTPAMIVDYLHAFDVVTAPRASAKRTLRWYIPVTSEDMPLPVLPGIDESQLLFICDEADALLFLGKHCSAFVVTEIDHGTDKKPFEPFRDRIIAIRKGDSPSYLPLLMQSFFTRILIWESDLERICLRHGSIGDMLDASVSIIGNFMFVSDNNFNVIARTSLIDPPDDLHRTIINNGCLTPHTIAEKRFRLPEKQFYTRPASDITPYDRVSCPIHVNHSYFGSISMSCNNMPDTEGLRDLFRLFIKHMIPLCETMWSKQTKLNIPSYFFFDKLIARENMSNEYFEAQVEMAGLSGMQRFCLVILDVDNNTEPDRARRAIKTASTLNGEDAIGFPYGSHILILMYAVDITEGISHRTAAEALEEKIVSPLGISCGVTSVFKSLTDLDIAYQQALVTLDYRNSIDRERCFQDKEIRQGVYFFEEALLYYLVDPLRSTAPNDERFVSLAFSCSIASDLYQEDLEKGTDYTQILWLYLQSDRNATAVAKAMHMHRNTVLYHVEKIQKQYHFDLASKAARDWLLVSYKVLFLSMRSRDDVRSEPFIARKADSAPLAR